MDNTLVDRARRDLAALAAWPTIMFGSRVEGGSRPGSDIDIAIITMQRDPARAMAILKECLGKVSPPYELHVFDLLPLPVRRTIVDHHVVIFGDPVSLSEYFYQTRKEWNDCKHRILTNQFSSFKEKLQLLEHRRLFDYEQARHPAHSGES